MMQYKFLSYYSAARLLASVSVIALDLGFSISGNIGDAPVKVPPLRCSSVISNSSKGGNLTLSGKIFIGRWGTEWLRNSVSCSRGTSLQSF